MPRVTELPAADHGRQAAARSVPDAARRLPILMYHEISAEPRLAGRLAVTPSRFAWQLGCLRDGGYTALRAEAARPALSTAGRPPARPVVLTFDDGFADFHDVALPLLSAYGLTATLFVSTGWIADGTRTGPARARRRTRRPAGTLSWRQIEEAAGAGIEIGSHSVSHPQLDQLGANELKAELAESKGLLEDRLGVAATGLSYPFGYFDQTVRDTAAALGYQYACAVGNRLAAPRDDPFALPRLTIGRPTGRQAFENVVRTGRLPAEFLGYRALATGYAALRHARRELNRIRR